MPRAPAELTLEAVFDAYFDCRRHKRNTLHQLAFEADLERNLLSLWRDLRAGELLEVLPDWRFAPADVYAVYPQRAQAPAKLSRFVAFLQAYIFTLLTAVYISLSIEEH